MEGEDVRCGGHPPHPSGRRHEVGTAMPFVRGATYTRDHIHVELGGETVTYLPQRGGRIVCGCFSQDSNPEAPYEILVGGPDESGGESTVERKARLLARQREAIPVFLKQGPNAWLYD